MIRRAGARAQTHGGALPAAPGCARRPARRYSWGAMLIIVLLLAAFLVGGTALFILVYYWGPKGPPPR